MIVESIMYNEKINKKYESHRKIVSRYNITIIHTKFNILAYCMKYNAKITEVRNLNIKTSMHFV